MVTVTPGTAGASLTGSMSEYWQGPAWGLQGQQPLSGHAGSPGLQGPSYSRGPRVLFSSFSLLAELGLELQRINGLQGPHLKPPWQTGFRRMDLGTTFGSSSVGKLLMSPSTWVAVSVLLLAGPESWRWELLAQAQGCKVQKKLPTGKLQSAHLPAHSVPGRGVQPPL